MTADVVDLAEYRARRLRREQYDSLVADLRVGVVLVPPSHATSEGLVGLLQPSRRSDDRTDALRHAMRALWRPVSPEDYRRDLSTVAQRWFPFGYDVAERHRLALVPPPRMTERRRQVRARRRRRRLSRGW